MKFATRGCSGTTVLLTVASHSLITSPLTTSTSPPETVTPVAMLKGITEGLKDVGGCGNTANASEVRTREVFVT